MLVIYEMANNHGGKLDVALKMLDAFGAVARQFPQFQYGFKTQYRCLPKYIHPSADPENKYVKRFRETDMSLGDRYELMRAIRKRGFKPICTPFDEYSVRLAITHGYEILKIGSPSITDRPLLDEILESWEGPIIASVGGATREEIDYVADKFHNNDLTLMHCVSEYPTPADAMQLNQIDWLKARYPGILIGFSSHNTQNTELSLVVAKGVSVIEKHISLEPLPNKYSLSPNMMRMELSVVVDALAKCGKEGERIPGVKPTQFMRRAMDGGMWWCPGEAAFPLDEIELLIKASGIVVPHGSTMDIYHHLGAARFRDIGAAIITCFNRDYCKKYIILLPGQTLPSHRHTVKEETFTLLYGDANDLQVGQTLLVEPGISHSLKSRGGAVLEEISTKYLPNDSEYLDEAIQNNPNRKTTI